MRRGISGCLMGSSWMCPSGCHPGGRASLEGGDRASLVWFRIPGMYIIWNLYGSVLFLQVSEAGVMDVLE